MPSVIRLKSSAYQSVPFSFGYGATCDVPAKVAEALEVGVNHAVSVRPHAVRMRMSGALRQRGGGSAGIPAGSPGRARCVP